MVEEHLLHKVAKYSGPTDAGPLPLALLRTKIHDCVIASPEGVRLTGVLADIMATTTPSQRYVRFYEHHLSRCLVQVLAAPPRYAKLCTRRLVCVRVGGWGEWGGGYLGITLPSCMHLIHQLHASNSPVACIYCAACTLKHSPGRLSVRSVAVPPSRSART